ncbi:uncharacterized protein LOC134272316 [Saccostrea cucullata]|uniref:uncharacterized protein LOC134272316 n=1 Tax=Saccostrea cuccullata TaxID=36930 RepID=UPI002ED26095
MEVSEYTELVNFLGSPPDRREWPVNTQVPLHSYDIILLPVCHHDHWFLMVGYPKLETLLILDSLPNRQREKQFARHWRCFMETRFQAEPSTPLSWTLSPIKSSVQKDGHSCGVFVLMNSAAILSHISPQVMRLCHIKAYRAYVRGELLTNGKADKRSLACDLPFCAASYRKQIQCSSCLRWCYHACLGIKEKDSVETCIYCA